MKNYKLIWLGIFCCLQPLILFAQRGETIRKAFLDPKSDQVLVVAHRGNWRSAPENSVAAIDSAIQMGVDIVEIDIHKTKDGQLILMHDDRVDRTTNGKGLIKDYTLAEIKKLKLKDKDGNLTEHIVPTLEEALLAGKGQIMFNLDKAYSVFDEVYAVLEKTGTASLVIMKGGQPVETVKSEFGDYLDKVIYIPVIGLDGKDGEKKVRDYMTQLHPAAFELVYSDSSSPLPRKVKSIILGKSRIWYNTLWASLAGGHEDDQALKDPDGNYGYLIEELGARILQTDRPGFMLDYLRKKGLHDKSSEDNEVKCIVWHTDNVDDINRRYLCCFYLFSK